MALVNDAKREINAKIVYFGPAAAGKTTSLNYIYRKLKAEFRSQLKTTAVQKDRLLFFDFLPPAQGGAGGYDVRFHIYTLVGETLAPASWKTILKGADGIVFMADSSPARQSANRESLAALRDYLAAFGKTLDEIPCIVQCNKQDVAAAVPPAEINGLLDGEQAPVLATVATKGDGVLEGLYQLVKMILKNLREGGFETANQPEVLPPPAAALQPPAAAAFAAEPAVAREFPFTPSEASAGGEEVPLVFPEPATPAPVEEIDVRPDGPATILDDGQIGIPLVIRTGTLEKRVTLRLTLSLSS